METVLAEANEISFTQVSPDNYTKPYLKQLNYTFLKLSIGK